MHGHKQHYLKSHGALCHPWQQENTQRACPGGKQQEMKEVNALYMDTIFMADCTGGQFHVSGLVPSSPSHKVPSIHNIQVSEHLLVAGSTLADILGSR